MNAGSPERLEMLRQRIRESLAREAKAKEEHDGLEQSRQRGNIEVYRHAIKREYGIPE